MTTSGNGHYDLAGTELADDGLDLVQKLESHLSIHPEDSETRGALQQLFAAPWSSRSGYGTGPWRRRPSRWNGCRELAASRQGEYAHR